MFNEVTKLSEILSGTAKKVIFFAMISRKVFVFYLCLHYLLD